jgi:predicted alpha/beta hydrolase
MKGQLDPNKCSTEELCSYAELCGWVLARAHARSGSASLISGYLGKGDSFDAAIGKFASRYADQTEKDVDIFKAAVGRGHLPAVRGV